MSMEALLKIFEDMPRGGPGSGACTRQALALIPDLAANPRILDLGCGPGKQTVVLATETGGQITAVDIFPVFLDQLRQNAEAGGVSHLITPREGDMADLPDAPGSYDLIWAEGSIYIMGFANGLTQWQPLLKPGGYLACTEAVWLTDNPSLECKEFWESEYPGISTLDACLNTAKQCGYEVMGHFALPNEVWWDEYYTPLLARLDQFRPRAAEIDGMADAISALEAEIDICRRYGNEYGYVFLVLEKIS